MQELCCQTAISPTSRKVNCRKNLTIGAICKNIVHHSVAVVATVERILLHAFASEFRRKANTINKTYDIISK